MFRQLLVPVIILAVWVLIARYRLVAAIFLPGPGELWDSFRGLTPLLLNATLTTLFMVLTGFLIGVTFGCLSGLIMAYSMVMRDLVGSVFDFMRPIPVFALIPLFILWFGIGRAPQVALVALGTSVILGVTTLEAVRNVPPIYMRAALTLGANRWQIYRSVIVPYIIPHLVGAIRVAAAAAWGLDVAAEFMGSQQGLGYLMIEQQMYLRTAGILVLVLIYCVLAIILDKLLRLLEAPLTRWTERRTAVGVVGTLVGGSDRSTISSLVSSLSRRG
jgi:ABC-type nitrate/sulfonate/bicarbonate transport system permease component